MTDLKMVNNPAKWPRWPTLPMKRRERTGAKEDFGFLYATKKPVIYFGNVFNLTEGMEPKPTKWSELLAKLERKEFPSMEALLDEYRVD